VQAIGGSFSVKSLKKLLGICSEELGISAKNLRRDSEPPCRRHPE